MTDKNDHSTLQRIVRGVKPTGRAAHGTGAPPTRPEPRALGATVRRRLEGIEIGLVIVLLVSVAASLSAPRATEPHILPLPMVDRRVLARAERREAELAEHARSTPLPFAVRKVGELYRRLGASTRPETGGASSGLAAELRTAADVALAQHGAPSLLALRAVQAELFQRAVRTWEADHRVTPELRELSGDFPELARASGWLLTGRLAPEEGERRLLFHARWTELTGLGKRPPFALTLDERRALYAFGLENPLGADAAARGRHRFGTIAALERFDPDYPAAFARGVLLFRAEAYAPAAGAFQAHLERFPDGPRTLLAKNHLLAALARSADAE
jgi:hypothetical protein